MKVWYLDSSAIVKFAVREAESAAIAAWRAKLGSDDVLMTCELAISEVLRAVQRVDGDVAVALAHVDALDQLVVDRNLLLAAGRLTTPGGVRTLDAIHLSAALAVGGELSAVVTYDDRMADSAQDLGIETLAPGRLGLTTSSCSTVVGDLRPRRMVSTPASSGIPSWHLL